MLRLSFQSNFPQHALYCLVFYKTYLSLFLVEAETSGFKRGRNLKKIGAKAQDTSELFFDNVEVPIENLVGEEGQGWNIAKFLLAHERSGIAGIAALKRELSRLKDLSSDIPMGEGSLLEDA